MTDEISALVLDPGYSCTCAGFAGEDMPKSVVPTHYGSIAASTPGGERKLLFGDNAINTPLAGMEIYNPMGRDGTVEDWETATKLWEYAVTSRLMSFRGTGGKKLDEEDGDAAMEDVAEGEKKIGRASCRERGE